MSRHQMTRRLYRIEHPETKQGPYNGVVYYAPENDDLREVLDKTQWSRNHPNPFDDGILGFARGIHKCAFTSLDKLCAWFDAETLAVLERHGFELKVIYVGKHDVLEGGHQCVYDPDGVTRVWRRLRPTDARRPEVLT